MDFVGIVRKIHSIEVETLINGLDINHEDENNNINTISWTNLQCKFFEIQLRIIWKGVEKINVQCLPVLFKMKYDIFYIFCLTAKGCIHKMTNIFVVPF